MKTLMICGNNYNQRGLAHRLNQVGPLSHIASVSLDRPSPSKRGKATKIVGALSGYPLAKAWTATMSYYKQRYPKFPDVPRTGHPSANSAEVIALVRRLQPDLVLVSGTDLLRPPLLKEIEKTGVVMNLHTGISPYIKGGPNCTNWALALGEFNIIGNTIMWLDAGIDSGKIIATERTELTGRETLAELHLKVMNHAHDLYRTCYRMYREGRSLPSVSQDELGKGRLFLTKHWTVRKRLAALGNFYFNYNPTSVSLSPDAGNIRMVEPRCCLKSPSGYSAVSANGTHVKE